MLICILTKNVITSCSVTMMLFLHLEVKPLMTLTTVLYLSCALISGHLAMMLMELTKRRRSEERFSRNAETEIVCRLLLEKKNAGEVKVRMAASGVCHSDLSMQNGTMMADPPMVIGHEGVVIVEELREAVTTLFPYTTLFRSKTSYDADNRPLLVMRSNLWASGYDVDGTDQTS